MLTALIGGVITGLLYAVSGLGLVVAYRASKVLNFALGGVGAVAAYLTADALDSGLPYWLVFPIAVLVGALLGMVLDWVIVRPLARRDAITVAIATLGALLILEGLIGLRFGYLSRAIPAVLDGGPSVEIGSVSVSSNQLFIVAISLVAIALMFLLINQTRAGLAMRAASSGPYTAELLGVDVARVRMAAWMVGGAYGALAALLVTPLTFLSPDSFTIFLLSTFTAVVLGGFTSLRGVAIGAVVFGVVVNVLVTYLDSSLITVYTLVAVTLALIFKPHGLFGSAERQVSEPDLTIEASIDLPHLGGEPGVPASLTAEDGVPPPTRRRRPLTWTSTSTAAAYAIPVVLLLLAPGMVTLTTLFLLATALATFVGVLGLNVLVGYTGQVTLANGAFLALGGYTAAIAAGDGIPLVPAILLGGLVSGAVGFVLGLPATRLEGVYLAVLTLIFAGAVPQLILYLDDLTMGSTGLSMPVPDAFYEPATSYYFVLGAALVIGGVVWVLAHGRVGRAWRAVRDSGPAARSVGINVRSVKLWAFCLGSALAGISGALGAVLVGFVGPDNYGVFVSIYALVAVIVGGSGSVIGSLIGAMFITFAPSWIGRFELPQNLAMGVLLIAVLLFLPTGVAGSADFLRRIAGRVTARRPGSRPASAPPRASGSGATATRAHAFDDASPSLLRLESVTAGYGRGAVLTDVSLDLREGEVVAVLGANGAGKSTLLRTVSGALRPSAGRVLFEGADLRAAQRPHDRARLGLAHVPEGRGIFPDLTVGENLDTARFASQGRPSAGAAGEFDLDRVLAEFPALDGRLRERAGNLSGGQQQMLAIGRALLANPRILMLDEPSLGLAPVVRQEVFATLRRIADAGVAIIIVEQNARAALALASRAYVLGQGRVLFDDDSDRLVENPRLQQAYLAGGHA